MVICFLVCAFAPGSLTVLTLYETRKRELGERQKNDVIVGYNHDWLSFPAITFYGCFLPNKGLSHGALAYNHRQKQGSHLS